MTIEEIAFWMMVAGFVVVTVATVAWSWFEDTHIRVDPTESERWYDERTRQ